MIENRSEIIKELILLHTILGVEDTIQKRDKVIIDNLSKLKALKKQIGNSPEHEQFNDFFSQIPFFEQEHNYNIEVEREIEDWKEEFDDIFPRRYYDRIGDVVILIHDFRADSIKEAINIIVQEDGINKQLRSLREQLGEQIRVQKTIEQFCRTCRWRERCNHFGDGDRECYSNY